MAAPLVSTLMPLATTVTDSEAEPMERLMFSSRASCVLRAMPVMSALETVMPNLDAIETGSNVAESIEAAGVGLYSFGDIVPNVYQGQLRVRNCSSARIHDHAGDGASFSLCLRWLSNGCNQDCDQ